MQAKTRLIKRVPIQEMDTVKYRQSVVGMERDPQLITMAEQMWMNMDEFRNEFARAIRFAYGDQWSEKIMVNGVTMTQRQYLQSTGNVVIQTNQIKSKVETIVGVMVKEKNMPICKAHDKEEQQYGEVITTALQANCGKNKMETLYIKSMEDLLLGGLAVCREAYEWRNGRLDSWTDYIDPNCVFFDSNMTDPRFGDLTLIGRFFDLTFEQLTARFAKTQHDYAILRDLYNPQSILFRSVPGEEFTDKVDNATMAFRTPYNPTKCRVFEIWTKESKPRIRLHDTNEGTEEVIDADDYESIKIYKAENKAREILAKQSGWTKEETPLIEDEFFIDEFWYCRYMAADGTIIWEGESPYADRMHPFSIAATPFVSGKIVGYMKDGIDHNVAMNRALILQDWQIRFQSKGVPVVPNKIVPDGDKNAFAKAWSSMDEIVFVDMLPGEENLMPKILTGNQVNFNASELVSMYKKLMEDSLAVSSALQGKSTYAGTSGSMYAQMVANSSTPIAALLSKFHSFLEDVHTKKMKNIAMFYDIQRFEEIVGSMDSLFNNANLRLNKIGDMEFDLIVKESTDTGVFRAIINDNAKEFLLNNLITFEEYLMIADMPYADKLLQMRQARQAEMQAAQNGEIPPEGMAAAGQQGQPPALM